MFGWNLSNCLGLLYWSWDQHGDPSFTFRTDNKTGQDSSHSFRDETREIWVCWEENLNAWGVKLLVLPLNSHWILSIYLFIFSNSHLFIKILCLLCPRLLVKHKAGLKLFSIFRLEEKNMRQMCPVPPIHFGVTTRSTNLLKAINNLNIALPGGGSWEGGGCSVWTAKGVRPGSAAPGPPLSPSAAGSALLPASCRDLASGCGSSVGLVSQLADASCPAEAVLSPPWLLPALFQRLVYV